jgi:hypothetical protein
MVVFSDYESKVSQSVARIAELKQAFLSFSIPDSNFNFVVDPDSREYLAPYISEVRKLQDYNLSVLSAIQNAKGIYTDLEKKGKTTNIEIPDKLTAGVQDRIRVLRGQIDTFKIQLERLKTIDPNSLETIIPAENKKQAEELKKAITKDLPAKIEIMFQKQQQIKDLFKDLNIVIPSSGENLPKR